jgi:hypothetical protein
MPATFVFPLAGDDQPPGSAAEYGPSGRMRENYFSSGFTVVWNFQSQTENNWALLLLDKWKPYEKPR